MHREISKIFSISIFSVQDIFHCSYSPFRITKYLVSQLYINYDEAYSKLPFEVEINEEISATFNAINSKATKPPASNASTHETLTEPFIHFQTFTTPRSDMSQFTVPPSVSSKTWGQKRERARTSGQVFATSSSRDFRWSCGGVRSLSGRES